MNRKDGKVVKENDDLMAATRYAVMMLRYARTEAARGGPARPAPLSAISVLGYGFPTRDLIVSRNASICSASSTALCLRTKFSASSDSRKIRLLGSVPTTRRFGPETPDPLRRPRERLSTLLGDPFTIPLTPARAPPNTGDQSAITSPHKAATVQPDFRVSATKAPKCVRQDTHAPYNYTLTVACCVSLGAKRIGDIHVGIGTKQSLQIVTR
jgi:hypothetical protein